jgi:hypothetical protein
MTMTGHFVDHGIRMLAAVVLLAVMSSPIRTPASHPTRSPNYRPRNFAILKNRHRGQFAMSACPSSRKADSIQSDIEDELDADIEDELTVKSPPTSASFDVLPSSCPEPYSEAVSLAVALAARPLRC